MSESNSLNYRRAIKASGITKLVWIQASFGLGAGLILMIAFGAVLLGLRQERLQAQSAQRYIVDSLLVLRQTREAYFQDVGGHLDGDEADRLESVERSSAIACDILRRCLDKLNHAGIQSAEYVASIDELTHSFKSFPKQHSRIRDLLHRTRDTLADRRAAWNRTQEILSQEKARLQRIAGQQRLRIASLTRSYERAKDEPEGAVIARRIVDLTGYGQTLVKLQAEINDLNLLVERLHTSVDLDVMVGMKDNEMRQVFSRLRRLSSRLDDEEADAIALLIDEVEAAIFGAGALDDVSHQTLVLGEGGLFNLQRQRLLNEVDLRALKSETAEQFVTCVDAERSLSQAAGAIADASSARAERSLRAVWRDMLLAGAVVSVLFLFLTQRLATVGRKSEYRRQEAEREMTKLIVAVEQSPVAVVITDVEGCIEYVNPRFTELTGYSAEETIGQNQRFSNSADEFSSENERLWQAVLDGKIWRGEIQSKKKNGELYWESASLSPVRNARNEITHVLTVKEDINARKQAEEAQRKTNDRLMQALERGKKMHRELEAAMDQLEVSATTDKLTGLPNRTVFLDRLSHTMQRARRDQSHFAVLFFDFDRFKIVNDSLGHKVGDALLLDIAQIFRDHLRESDTVARFGGDEFVVLLDQMNESADALTKARSLLEVFNEPHVLEGHLVVSTASIGLVTNEYAYRSPGDMIRDADAAMYQAKEAGRAQVVVFDSAMHSQALRRLSLEADLRQPDCFEQFQLVYQPIIELTTGALSGFEALIRWHHPKHGLITPAEFIPIAEDTGLIIEIGRWILKTAARQIALWNNRPGLRRRLTMNVNIAKRQVLGSSILEDILDCIESCDIRPSDLNLEVTESTIADNRSDVVPILNQLRENGLAIAMDDFGTGSSSLSALHEYPIDVLKIDQSFVKVLSRDRSLLAIVAAITTLAENLGIKTVAEGIESGDVIGVLQSIGCTWGQGYHFARPLDASDAEEYMLKHNQLAKSA